MGVKRLVSALALVLLTSCTGLSSRPQPAPTPPPATVSYCAAPTVRDAGDGRPILAHVEIAGLSGDTNAEGYLYLFGVPAGQQTLTVTAPGYREYRGGYAINSWSCDMPITLEAAESPFVPLPQIVTRGQFFALDTGARITLIGHSDFFLFGRYLNGEDIEPVLTQRAAAGFNVLRVWTRMQLAQYGIGDLTLVQHPDLYEKLVPFLRLCARHGLYVQLTVYAGREDYDPAHWDRLVAAVRGETNVILELVNENDQAGNKLPDLSLFRRPVGILASHGSNGAEQLAVRPAWDYEVFHTNGASEEQRKIGHNAMELSTGTPDWPASHVPVFTNESSRYPDVGMWRGADFQRAWHLAFDAAAGAALLAGGSLFHDVAGKNSTLWDDDAREIAKAWAAGARSVDLACQDGPYRRLDPLDKLRRYERPVSGHQCLVEIRK